MRLSNFNVGEIPINERVDIIVKLSTLPDDEIVPVEMAAIFLNRELNTIYQYTSKGILPTVKYGMFVDENDKPINHGKAICFRMSDLREFKSRTKIRLVKHGKRVIKQKLSS